jgi:biopolymer transport protein ExbB
MPTHNVILLAASPETASFVPLLIDMLYYVLIPLVIVSIPFYIIYQKKKKELEIAAKLDDNVLLTIYKKLDSGDMHGAHQICEAHMNQAFFLIIQKGLNSMTTDLKRLPINEIDKSVTDNAKIEFNRHKFTLDIFASAVSIAPSIGFLGTLLGMLFVFYETSSVASPELKDIAGGIYTKVFSSIDGIALGLFCKWLHVLLTAKLNLLKGRYNEKLVMFLDQLLLLKSKSN